MVLRAEKSEALRALAHNRETLGVEPGQCMMCALARGRPFTEPIAETDDAIVLLDRFGARPGHLMIVAKVHVESILALGWQAYERCQRLAFEACATLEKTLAPTRIFVASLGAPDAVPMSFPHFHVHVIPLFERGDETRPARVFSWTDGVVLYEDDEAAELTARLRNAWHHESSATSPLRGRA